AADRRGVVISGCAAVTDRDGLAAVGGRRGTGRQAQETFRLRACTQRRRTEVAGGGLCVQHHFAAFLVIQVATDRGARIPVRLAAAAAGQAVVASGHGVVAAGGAELARRKRAAAECRSADRAGIAAGADRRGVVAFGHGVGTG